MSITTDVRKYGENVLDEARKPWYAAVGAERPGLRPDPEAADPAAGRGAGAGAQAPWHRRRAGRGRPARRGRHARPGRPRRPTSAYTGLVREQYQTLAHRGELVVRRLRRSPEVREAFDKAEELVSDAGQKVGQAEDKVTQPGSVKTATPRRAAARKAPAKRTAKS